MFISYTIILNIMFNIVLNIIYYYKFIELEHNGIIITIIQRNFLQNYHNITFYV